MADKNAATATARTPAAKASTTSGSGVSFEVEMVQEKVTKGTIRYQEDHGGDDTKPDRIGQLYLQKHNFPNGAPQRIVVTVESVD